MRFTLLRGGGASARAHVSPPSFPYLGNGRTDCVEIWYVVRDQLARQCTPTEDGVHLHVRAPFPYLGSRWKDCVEICHVGRDIHQFCVLYKSWMGYQYLHVPDLGVHGSILLKYGVLFDPLTMNLTQL